MPVPHVGPATDGPARGQNDLPTDRLDRGTRRRVRAFQLDAVLDAIGFNILAPSTVVQEFVTHLTRLNFVVGLPAVLAGAIYGLSQPIASWVAEQSKDVRRHCIKMRTLSRPTFLILGISVPALAVSHPALMITPCSSSEPSGSSRGSTTQTTRCWSAGRFRPVAGVQRSVRAGPSGASVRQWGALALRPSFGGTLPGAAFQMDMRFASPRLRSC